MVSGPLTVEVGVRWPRLMAALWLIGLERLALWACVTVKTPKD